ncbi:uncharacterized protein LOC126753678 [Bactrocera neohumeralis]|uniref:uncharacterized protein LOC120766934 n=1 Tax=Bactrocera tryoni TaxID=59916 RepID=UPI001A9729C3|nr:uncharacterized protein LOC120766934 [Bactrocera tryoni]XP_050321314.1 uncharacterized protein LOC126753678 [Bactrocera neohumeralis]
MVALSKFIKYLIDNDVKCSGIFHDHSCKRNALLNTYKFMFSNMKYFAPVIGLPLLMRIRSLNRKLLQSTLIYYVEAVLAATAVGWSIQIIICFLRHLLGKFTYLTFILLPTFIGSFCTFMVPSPRVHSLFSTTIFQCTLESLIMLENTALTKLIANSSLIRTFIFMCCSALILNAKRKKTYKGFWLMEPTPYNATAVEQTGENDDNATCNSSCNHKDQSCQQYALQGIRNFMLTGLGLDAIKMLMSNVPSNVNGFMAKLCVKLKAFKLRSFAILTSYVAIYRLLHCYFNRNFGGDSPLNHSVAAFLSGSGFIFFPKLTLLSYAMVGSLQISWQYVTTYLTEERFGDTYEWVKRLPCRMMFYPIALAYLVNAYVINKNSVSKLGGMVINGITNNYVRTTHASVEIVEHILARCSPAL